MSRDFSTVCPHCGLKHAFPYEDVRHHSYHILGTESAKRCPDLKKHLAYMQEKRKEQNGSKEQKPSVHQQALLELSKRENLDDLKLREIADKIGLTGKHRISYISRMLYTLNEQGLISIKRRMPLFAVQQV